MAPSKNSTLQISLYRFGSDSGTVTWRPEKSSAFAFSHDLRTINAAIGTLENCMKINDVDELS